MAAHHDIPTSVPQSASSSLGSVTDNVPLPKSTLYELRSTPHAGRGVYATQDLPNGTVILSTSSPDVGLAGGGNHEMLSPTAHTIFRPYRREVCAECFAYDRGHEWKVKLSSAETGMVFCEEACQARWLHRHGQLGVEAFAALESVVRMRAKRRDRDENVAVSDPDPTVADNGVMRDLSESERVKTTWTAAAEEGQQIRGARNAQQPTKASKKAIRRAIEAGLLDVDVAYLILTGVLNAYGSAARQYGLSVDSMGAVQLQLLLPSMLALYPDVSCYKHPSSPIEVYVSAYLTLLAILPRPLLPFLTPDLSHELCARASHNAFSIRPGDDVDGHQSGEYMGWGIWPEASLFNHSCKSNLAKQRKGRCWQFTVNSNVRSSQGRGAYAGIRKGEEVCITYLGGDEYDLNVNERRQRLEENWGFNCICQRCVVEKQASNLSR